MQKYDVFISFKNLGSGGVPTRDSELAHEVYDYLKQKGISAFLSNVSLERLGVSNYKSAIDDALDVAHTLVAVGTTVENFNSQWVRYEWDSFYNDILSDVKPNGRVFVYVEGIDTSKLPRALRQSQTITNGLGALDHLTNFILNNVLSRELLHVQLPENTSIELNGKKNHDNCSFPRLRSAKREDVKYIAELEYKEFPKDSVPLAKLDEWYLANPSGFFVLCNKGKRVGQITILGIKPERLKEFVSGKIHETEIKGIDLYSFEDNHLVQDIYIESLIVSKTSSENLKEIISFFYSVGSIFGNGTIENIYALAATPKGARLLEKLKFKIFTNKSIRKDEVNLYCCPYPELQKTFKKILHDKAEPIKWC